MSTVHSIPPYHHSKWHQVAELVDVKILAFELQERYADLLALKRDMKRYTKSHSTIDRGNFLRYLTAASELVVGKGNFLRKQISPDFLPFAYLVNNEDNEVLWVSLFTELCWMMILPRYCFGQSGRHHCTPDCVIQQAPVTPIDHCNRSWTEVRTGQFAPVVSSLGALELYMYVYI